MPRLGRSGLGMLAAAGGVALLSAACTFEIDTNGETVSKSFDVEDFDQIEIAQAFEATIVVGDATGVEFEINKELLDLLEVEVEDDRLVIGVGGGLVSTSGPMRVTITTPDLSALSTGGAAEVDIESLDASDFDLEVTGAADVTASGTITNLDLEVAGASNVDLSGTAVDTATVSIDGASNVELTDVSSVSGSVSGASSIDVPDSDTFDIDASGASSVD